MGPAINQGKTKYILSASRDVLHIGFHIMANNYTFNIVKEFIYLGSAVTTNVKMVPVWRSSGGSLFLTGYYYNLNRQLSNRDLTFTTKLILYMTLILPILLYGREVRTLSSFVAVALVVFERKVQLRSSV